MLQLDRLAQTPSVCLRRDKCDPTAIWKLADKYLSSFNDISMLMYRQEFQKRLTPFLS